MHSPLEQFDLIYLGAGKLAGLDISLFHTVIALFFITLLLFLATLFFSSHFLLLSYGWQQGLESIYGFLYSLVKEQGGHRSGAYIPLVSTLFLLILFANLLSLMPFGEAITSHLIVTIYLSFTLIFSLFVLGLYNYNLYFLKLFVPECPFPLLFLLVPIELFSHFVRCFSLAIRLSANILAGHTLVFIVSGFLLKIANLRFWLFMPLLGLLILLFLLEFGVAFLQAYVFVVLFSIYLKDSLEGPSH